MNERLGWVFRYAVVIAAALLLGYAFGEMALFKTTRIGFGRTGVSAARLAQFLGYGGALLVLWLLAKRAAELLPSDEGNWNVLKSTLLPGTTLVVIAAGQAVLLLLLRPLMSKVWLQYYNWVSIAAIILAAIWLLGAVLTGSSSLAPLFGGRGARRARIGQSI